jgi:hypothetical protein
MRLVSSTAWLECLPGEVRAAPGLQQKYYYGCRTAVPQLQQPGQQQYIVQYSTVNATDLKHQPCCQDLAD